MIQPAYFITGIGTEVGKTVVSAIFTEALAATYWKPVQAGELDNTDTQKVKNLVSDNRCEFRNESYRLKKPASPHQAAAEENILIDLDNLRLPETNKALIVEGAGGLHVPLNNEDLMIDLIFRLNLPVVLVCNMYLGSINHSLLSIEALMNRKIDIVGLVFNGPKNAASEEIILRFSQLPMLLRIEQEQYINQAMVRRYAYILKENLTELGLINFQNSEADI